MKHLLSAPGRTRTDTERILSPLPLPLGYQGSRYADVKTLGYTLAQLASPYDCLMKKAVIALIALLLSLSLSPMAIAGTDKYESLQTQVTYQIFKPSNTLGLKALNFEVRACRLFPKREKALLAGFGGMDHGIALVETSAQYNCTGVDNPQSLGTTKINGTTAQVGIYCATNNCKASTFSQHGGEITFVTPKSQKRASTYIRVGTQGGFTLQQLITFASGLKPVLPTA